MLFDGSKSRRVKRRPTKKSKSRSRPMKKSRRMHKSYRSDRADHEYGECANRTKQSCVSDPNCVITKSGCRKMRQSSLLPRETFFGPSLPNVYRSDFGRRSKGRKVSKGRKSRSRRRRRS